MRPGSHLSGVSMAFRRLPRPLPPAHRGDRYPTRRQAGQHGACLGRSGRTPPVSIGMSGPRCSTITRRPCLFSAVCAAVAPDRPLCFPQMRAHKPCFRRPLVPQNHPPRAPDKHRHSRNTRTCGSQGNEDARAHVVRRSGVRIVTHALDLDVEPAELLATMAELVDAMVLSTEPEPFVAG